MASPKRLPHPRRTSEFREPPAREYKLSPEGRLVMSILRSAGDPYAGCDSQFLRGQRERTLANLTTRGYVERVEGKWRVKT